MPPAHADHRGPGSADAPMTPCAVPPAARAGWTRALFDLGFIFLLFATVIGSVYLVAPLVLFAILPLALFAYPQARTELRRREWTIIALALFYPLSSLVMLFAVPAEVTDPRRELFQDYYLQLYLFSILCFAIGYQRGLQMPDFFALYRRAAPWFVFLSFAAFTALSYSQNDICLAQAWTGLVFIPAITFTTLVFLSFIGWAQFRRVERFLRMLGLMLAILVVVAFTGRRGIFFAILAVVAVLLVLNLLRGYRGKVPGAWVLLGGLAGGLLLSLAAQWYTGCNIFGRIETIFRPVVLGFFHSFPVAPAFASNPGSLDPGLSVEEIIAGARDVSISLRLQFYLVGIESALAAPVFGHGLLEQLDLLAPFNETHMHSQFLTWAVTGGIVRLVIGCLFLALPLVIARDWPVADRVLAGLALTGIWGASLVTDSLLEWHFFLQFYSLLLGLIAGVCAARARVRMQE